MPTRRVVLGFSVLFAAGCVPTSGPPFDQQFIDMMVPHHEGALAMAEVLQRRTQRAEMRQLAADILRTQKIEIDQMKKCRKEWFGSDATPSMREMPMVDGMKMDHSMPGMSMRGSRMVMDMQRDVDTLGRAGEPFDRAFIDMMIPHHQSAIDAATAAATRAQRQEIKDLARNIIRDQQREIDQMRGWRRAWFGG